MRNTYRYFIIQYKNIALKNKLNCFLGYLLLWIPLIAFAGIEQHGKLWLGLDKSGLLLSNSDWLYVFSAQMRGITSSEVLQTFFFDGRLGYPFFTELSVWFGYRWSGNYPGNGFYSEHRPYQQIQFPLVQQDSIQFTARSRLEERIRNDQNQLAIRFRQRIALEIKHCCVGSIHPYFYDEVFFRLNKTDFTPNNVLSEHRFFAGIRIYELQQSYVQLGYINQYTYKTSPLSQNAMSHILEFTYDF